MKSASIIVLFFVLFTPSAKAWDCPKGQIRQQAPAGTPGAVVVEGIPFICVSTPTPGASNTNQNINTNTNKINVVAQGGAGGSANQKQQQTQTQSQTQTASVSNSGNSTSTSSATENGDNSNNSTFNQVRQTSSALAPPQYPSASCFKTYGGAAQGPAFGFSIGGGKIDRDCSARELARSFIGLNNPTAAARVLCETADAKRAHLTLDDCLAIESPATAQAIPPASITQPNIIVPAPQVTVNLPAPIVQAPAPAVAPAATPAAPTATPKKPIKRHPPKPCPDTKPSGSPQ
jgi:hypothetical protein